MPITPKKIPITRNNLWFSKEDYDYEMSVAQDYLEQDLGTSVILYQVDRSKTNVNQTYMEAGENQIRFKTPVEVPCMYKINPSENRAYDQEKSLGVYEKVGNIDITVFTKTLEELGCDFNRGDYIGVMITSNHIEYFTVSNAGKKNYSNEETMYGYLPYYRKIEAVTVDVNEFSGK